MTTPRPTWSDTWLDVAAVIAQRAPCTRRQVGAVVVSPDRKELLGVGYNGVAAGLLNCSDGGCERGKATYDEIAPLSAYTTCPAIHAEANAIARAGDTEGCHIYITCEPCQWCEEAIEAAGIVSVTFPSRTS